MAIADGLLSNHCGLIRFYCAALGSSVRWMLSASLGFQWEIPRGQGSDTFCSFHLMKKFESFSFSASCVGSTGSIGHCKTFMKTSPKLWVFHLPNSNCKRGQVVLSRELPIEVKEHLLKCCKILLLKAYLRPRWEAGSLFQHWNSTALALFSPLNSFSC